MPDERVLVTGGSGFIGTNLVEALLTAGVPVLSIDVKEPRLPSHRSKWLRVDLTDSEALLSAVQEFRPHSVYHLGARTDLESDNVEEYPQNTAGTQNVIQACADAKCVRRVIFASSRLVCRIGYQPVSDTDYCPTTAYGKSKVLAEDTIRGYAELPFEWLIVRPTSIWGPWFDVPYKDFFDAVSHGRYVHPCGESIRKSFGYVGNSVFQLRKLMEAPSENVAGKTFYIGDYEPIEVGTFASHIAREFGVRPPVSVPVWVLKTAAKTGDLLARTGYRRVPLTSFRLANMRTEMLHDFADLAEITGPLPFTAKEGVEVTVAWMKEQGC